MIPRVEDMDPRLREKWGLWDKMMKEAGLEYKFTRIASTLQEQIALYVQGRLPIEDVNTYRRLAGLPTLIGRNVIITMVVNSAHVVTNEVKYAKAFDIVLFNHGDVHWDLKADVNANHLPDYAEAGGLWQKLGGVWGGVWRSVDACHFQLHP